MFRLHEYSGKETGLMIMGTSEDLASIGQALIDYSKDKKGLSTEEWPPLAVRFNIENSNYEISFHQDIASKIQPKTNKPTFIVFKLVTFIAGICCGIILALLAHNIL